MSTAGATDDLPAAPPPPPGPSPARHGADGGARRRGLRRPLPPLRLHLLALAMAGLLPALAAGGFAAWDAVAGHRRAFQARMAETARALAQAMDAELHVVEAALHALAAANELEPGGDLAGFHARRTVTAEALGIAFVLIGPGPVYPRLLDTRRPFGASLGAGLMRPEDRSPAPRTPSPRRRPSASA